MAKKTTIKLALADGTTREESGIVAILPLGNRNLRALIHGETLSHIATGLRICDLRPYMILNHRSNRRRDKRADALLAMQDLEAKIGAAEAWQIIDSAPTFNGKGV